jgi:putative tricarboxylic transport membrane protein
MLRADAVVGLLLIALAAAMAWGARTLHSDEAGIVGPAFLPLVVAALLAVLGILTIVRSARSAVVVGDRLAAPDRQSTLRIALLFGAIALFLVMLDKAPMLGFPLLAPPLLFVLIVLFGGRFTFRTALVAVVIAEAIYLAFVKWLGLLLPASAWF